MPVALLDVNVLLALAWPPHVHHEAAHRWFAQNRSSGWATCPLTQLAFLRLSIQPSIVKANLTFADAQNALVCSLAVPEHQFWSLDYPFSDVLPEVRARLAGHHQLTDAVLLDLAIRHAARLATFDRRVAALLPPESPHRHAIELLSAE